MGTELVHLSPSRNPALKGRVFQNDGLGGERSPSQVAVIFPSLKAWVHRFTLTQRNLFLLFTDREQLIAGDPFGRILVLDPNVAHRDVFQELAGQLEEAIQSLDIECVLERFKRMPKVAKRQIYTFYEHLLKSKGLSYSGSVKDVFYDSNQLSFDPKLKARAIYLYLEQLNHNENLQHGQHNRYQ